MGTTLHLEVESMKWLSSKIAEGYQLLADNPNQTGEWYRTMNRDLIKYTERLETSRKRYMMVKIPPKYNLSTTQYTKP